MTELTTAADNFVFVNEDGKPWNEIKLNEKSKSSKDKVSHVQISGTEGNQNSSKDDNRKYAKRVSFPDKIAATPSIKLYKRRFWILTLFSVCSMLNGMQWMQYTVVADVSMCFYDVSLHSVNWTANLYLILYAPLVFPVSWFIDKMGVRNSLLVGSLLTCLGTALQCGATTPDSFTFALVSQASTSVGQVFILGLPPYISATWFGADEISRASAVGVFGNQLGCALSFIFVPLVVSRDCNDKALITYGKEIVAYSLVSCNVLVLILILTTFQEKPKIPPSIAEAKKVDESSNYLRSVLALLKNVNYDLLLLTYGIIVGVYFAVSTILNSLVSAHFFGKDTEIGWMGLIAILCGTVGSIIAGYVLDWKHRYKETSVAIFVLSFLSMILFSALLYVNLLWLQFVTIAILGFFLTSYLPVGFEFAVEITYPESEAISAQLLNASTMLIGLIFTEIAAYLDLHFNDVAANAFFCAVLLLGTIITSVIKCDFRRQKQKDQTEGFPNGI